MKVTHFELLLTACWRSPCLTVPSHLLLTIQTVHSFTPFWHAQALTFGEDFAGYVLYAGMPLGSVVELP